MSAAVFCNRMQSLISLNLTDSIHETKKDRRREEQDREPEWGGCDKSGYFHYFSYEKDKSVEENSVRRTGRQIR